MLILNLITLISLVYAYATESFTRYEMKINEVKQFNTTQCHLITLNPLMKKVRFTLMQAHSIKSVILSDTPLLFDCFAENLLEGCTDKNLCLSFTDIKDTLEVSLGFCTDTIYIYITPQRYTLYKASFTIHSRYLPSPCNSIMQTSYTKCGRYSSNECGQVCHEGCVYVGCRSRQQQFDKFGLCLPNNLGEQQYLSRCQMDKNISTYNIVDVCKGQKVEKSTTHIILIVIFLLITGIVVIAIYYRYKLIKSGNPPFNVPGFVPTWLFPRSLDRLSAERDVQTFPRY